MIPQTSVTIKATGPMFDGTALRVVDDFIQEANREVGQAGVNEVRSRLGSVLQNPTGHYESQIATDLAQSDLSITDGGVIYGPWLEGTSSRNQSSRFKGYQTFRKVRQWLEGKAGEIAESKIRPYLGRMGGS